MTDLHTHVLPGMDDGSASVEESLHMLSALAIEGSRLLLVEMPFTRWSGRVVQELIQLHTQGENRVLLAHIERYLHAQEPAVWERLLRAGVLMQANAGFFLHWRTRHRAVRMLREGRIHLLGSDTHNMSTRPPELGRALQGIGPEGRQRLAENERLLLPRWEGEGPV